MKVAFTSGAEGGIGVTSNLACISVATVLEYSYKTILFENHCQNNKLENILRYHSSNYYLKEDNDYKIGHIGLGSIIEDTYQEREDTITDWVKVSKVLKKAYIEILDNKLFYIPPRNLSNLRMYEFDLHDKIKPILKIFETFADITYIDTTNKNNLSSKIILDEVDLVVVNLIQNHSMIQHFFDNYSSILHKCVFIISNYRKKSKLNINRISKIHAIDKSNIATIPYNVEYQEAVIHGNVVDFLLRNFLCKRNHPNYNFIKELKRAVEMIMRSMGLTHKEEYL